ncbi:hypothetical protein R2R35_00820 [Anaerocolumna sp. AGMB13020]|uniref:hypothetical protein n=1 Tax=Anaerocolumna sp. AGMB13020 TaxID=3081750 RepID=UPI002952E4D2|nr:hypothetical protein [Anaerocolumna sp. AGMB13020]WOO37068.1 hypothetical protein R2R35_00820 [Anaerocolumna sp. AGMB13020]
MKKRVYIGIIIILSIAIAGFGPVYKNINKSIKYKLAFTKIEEKKYPQAIGILRKLNNYKESKDIIHQLQYVINGSYIANGIWAAAAITPDGKVRIAYNGNDKEYASSDSWQNIKALSFHGGDSLEGLTEEGKIITTSTTTAENLRKSAAVSTSAMADIVTAVASWKDITAFQTFYPQSAVALDKEGFVYAAYPFFNNGLDKLNGWSNITAIADGRSYVAGLRADGSVLVDNYNYYGSLDTSDWQDIVALSASTSLIGLKDDGTVIATGLNNYGEGNVEDWKDIIAISTSRFCTLGLKRDGTVVAVGNNPYGAMDINEWSDIVAIQAGDYFSIGLRADGSMVLAGDSRESGKESPEVSSMKNLYVPFIDK